MKRRAWKMVLGLAAGSALVAGLVLGDGHRRASATFAFHEKELAAMYAALRARDASRDSVFADPLAENAWTHYPQAFAAFEAMPNEDQEAFPEMGGEWEEGQAPDDHLLHGLVAKYQPQVALLEKAVRCRIVEPGYHYELGAEMPLDWLSGALRASRFLSGAISHHHRTGNGGEALELAAVGLAMGQDLSRKGPLICSLIQYVCEGSASEAIRWTLADGHSYRREDLERFAARLEALDRRRPPLTDAWDAEDAYLRNSLLRTDWNKVNFGLFKKSEFRPGWRQLFSERIMRASALNLNADVMARARRLPSLPPLEGTALATQLTKEVEDSDNSLVRAFMPSILRVLRRDQAALLGRLLLRISVALARYQLDHGRDPARLEDLVPKYLPAIPTCPLTGTPLRYRAGKVWSIGINGKDEGGVDPESGAVDDGGDDGDVVWTVRRR